MSSDESRPPGPPASDSANGQFDRDRDRTPDKALRDVAPELADIGGETALPFNDDRKMLRAAAETLRTFGVRESNDERRARLLLLAGYLFGMSFR